MTLLELLVAMAILGMLVALLLPAIQATRESTRRTTCKNNLRQIGVALIGFDSLRGRLPMGARGDKKFGVSWWIDTMPFLEENDLQNRLDKSGPFAGWAVLNSQNAKLADGFVMSVSICPSSPLAPLYPVGVAQLMMPSYVGIAGATNHDGFPETRVSTCCAPENQGQISSGGVLISNQQLQRRHVTDGSSNVMVVGEASDYARDAAGRTFRIDAGMPLGWIAGTASPGTPPTYAVVTPVPPSWNITTIRYPVNMGLYGQPGIHDNRGANNPLVSAHTGGINALFLDGAVKFLCDDTEVRLLKQFATRDDGQVLQQGF